MPTASMNKYKLVFLDGYKTRGRLIDSFVYVRAEFVRFQQQILQVEVTDPAFQVLLQQAILVVDLDLTGHRNLCTTSRL